MRNILIVLLTLAIGIDLLLESLFSQQYRKEQELVVLEQVSTLRAKLEGTLNANLHLVSGLTAMISLHPRMDNEEFTRLAAELFTHENQLRNIAAAPDLVIRYIYPLEGNRGALGLDYTKNPAQREAALRARDSGKMVVAGPVKLVQGGSGLIARLPVFVDHPDGDRQFWGLVSTVLDTDRLYQRAGLTSDNQSLQIALRGRNSLGERGDVFYGDPELFRRQAVVLDISLPTGSWQVAALPAGGWEARSPERWLIRFLVLSVTLLGVLFIFVRSQQERHKRLSEAKFSAAFNESPLGMAISSLPETALVEVNEAFESITGYSREECLRENLKQILRVHEHQRLLAEAQPTGHLTGVDLEGQDAKGRARHWRYFASRFETPAGPHLLTLVQDVTQQRQLTQELELAKQVMDNTSDGVIIADRDTRIVEVNNAFTQITGYSRDEALGRNTGICKSGRHEPGFYETMWRHILSEGHWSGEIWNRRKSGDVFPTWLSINLVRDEAGNPTHYIGVFSDISKIKQAERELEQLAYYDPLTALPNRTLFRDRLSQKIASARRHKERFGLLFIDLDRFKHINDSFGHNVGDQLLHEIACRLAQQLRESDTAARLGGDEFTLILSDVSHLETVTLVAERILEALQAPIRLAGQELHVGASIGIAIYPEDGENSESLIQHADMAMYQAKAAGRNTFNYYTHKLQENALRRMSLESELRRGLEQQQFALYYQPKVDLASGRVFGMEALVRWIHPQQGLVSPLDFIPLAEETGLIIPLGRWILEEACRQTRQWQEQGYPHLKVAVNLSARQFAQPELASQVREALNRSQLSAGSLELELTESMLVADTDHAVSMMNELRGLGAYLSIDDFGTGYSSLSYLKRFPLHTLKIDQSFVRDLTIDSEDAAIIKAIIFMTKGLGLNVIAEGIETLPQLEFLLEHGCPSGQGYLFSAPLPAVDFLPWLRRQAGNDPKGSPGYDFQI